jgi:hypothetical protein
MNVNTLNEIERRKYIARVTCDKFRAYSAAGDAFSGTYDKTKKRAANGDAKALREREVALTTFNAAHAAADAAFTEAIAAVEEQ